MARQRSRTVTIGDLTFDSVKESQRYLYLLACEQDGLIQSLVADPDTLCWEAAPRTVLPVNELRPVRRVLSRVTYTPDFRYTVSGVVVIEDYKAGYSNSRKNRQKKRAGKPIVKSGQRRLARQMQAAMPEAVFRYCTSPTAPPNTYRHRAYTYLHRS